MDVRMRTSVIAVIVLLMGMLAGGCASASPPSSERDRDTDRDRAAGRDRDRAAENADRPTAFPLLRPTGNPPTQVPKAEAARPAARLVQPAATRRAAAPVSSPAEAPRTVWEVKQILSSGDLVIEGQISGGEATPPDTIGVVVFTLYCVGNRLDWVVNFDNPLTTLIDDRRPLEVWADGSPVLRVQFEWPGKGNPITTFRTTLETAEKTGWAFLDAQRSVTMSFFGVILHWDDPVRLRQLAREALSCVP